MKIQFAFFVLFLLLSASISSISIEQAKSIGGKYLSGTGETLYVSSELPITYKGERYWLLYYAPQDSPQSKGIVVAVNDYEGAIETKEDTLKQLYGIDFDIDLLNFIKQRQISYSDLKTSLDKSRSKIASNGRAGLGTLESQSAKYPSLSFSDVDNALQELEDKASSVSSSLDDNYQHQLSFEQTYEAEELALGLKLYNSTFDSFSELVAVANKYRTAVSEKQKEVLKSNLPDATVLYNSLDVMKDIELDASLTSMISSRRKEIDVRISKKDNYVNDTVSSFYFRKAKVEATGAYAEQKQKVENLLSANQKINLDSCKISTKELKTKWEEIRRVMEIETSSAEQYFQIPAKVSSAGALADSLNQQLTTCLQGSPTIVPIQKTQDYSQIAVGVFFVAIIGYAVYQFRKQQMKAQDEQQ